MKKNLLQWILILTLSSFSISGTFAQDRTITGTIRNEQGVTLPGASVSTKDLKRAVTTDMNGRYSITIPAGTKVLSVSFVGMEGQDINLGKSDTYDLTLKLTNVALTDVVIVGYGTAFKKNINSSIASISEKDIKNLPVAGADQALQGKIAGVTVTTNSGQPGGGVSVRVRGITSVIGNNQPLYVIDGVPIMTNSNSTSQDQLGGVPGQNQQSILATLNPSDIASIDILKDASAQAIYGSLGAYGVIIITTKKGKSGEGKINYDVYYGWQKIQKKLPLMNLHEWAQYYNSVVGEGTVSGLDTIGEFKDPSVLGGGTDWQDAVFQTGQMANHQLSFSGGSNKTTYYFSGNYFNQTGTVLGSEFNRYAARISIDQQVKSWLKAGITANLSRTNQRITLTDGQQSVISLMLYNSPATPVKAFDGSYVNTATISGVPFGNTQNPVALALLRDVRSIQSKGFGNLFVELQFTKDLVLHNQLNYDYQLTQNNSFQPKILYPSGVLAIGPSKLRQERNTSYFYSLQNYLTYNHTFLSNHNVNVTVGHESWYSNYETVYATATDLTENLPSLSAGTKDPAGTGSGVYESAQDSYFGRVNYTYKNKYSFSGSVRRDGSSNFGPGKRYGTFPAGSIGWTISNEPFMAALKPVNYLKLRFGYGAVGGSNSGGQSLYTTNVRLVTNALGLFGQNVVPGVPANVGNPFLKWESVITKNAGLDATLLNRRLELTIDFYQKVTTDLILPTKLPVFAGLDPNPPNNSYQEIEPPTTNAGKMTNTGFDLGITSYNMQNKNITWKTSVVFSRYKNTLNELNSQSAFLKGVSQDFNPQILTITKIGGAVGRFYGFVTDGIYRSMEELNKGPIPMLPIAPDKTWLGDIRYKDLDGDGKITDADQTYIGNPNPKFTYGITNTVTYKDFDLSIFLSGVYGNDIYNYARMLTEANYNVYQNQLNTVMDRYTATNPGGSLPRYNQWNQNNLKISDRFVESGSYLRIQNITLAYNFKTRLISKAKMNSARIYVAAQNLHTFTKYKGYDPELGSFNNSVLLQNIDYGHYPTPRTFTIGANIEF
jgi:TonB-linked SusC/RagA family outer membrane protein